MSKCREAFESSGCKDYDTWRIAWDAAMARAAEICNEVTKDGAGIAGIWSDRYAIAIERENENAD